MGIQCGAAPAKQQGSPGLHVNKQRRTWGSACHEWQTGTHRLAPHDPTRTTVFNTSDMRCKPTSESVAPALQRWLGPLPRRQRGLSRSGAGLLPSAPTRVAVNPVMAAVATGAERTAELSASREEANRAKEATRGWEAAVARAKATAVTRG